MLIEWFDIVLAQLRNLTLTATQVLNASRCTRQRLQLCAHVPTRNFDLVFAVVRLRYVDYTQLLCRLVLVTIVGHCGRARRLRMLAVGAISVLLLVDQLSTFQCAVVPRELIK